MKSVFIKTKNEVDNKKEIFHYLRAFDANHALSSG
jgi:hypothetical protein